MNQSFISGSDLSFGPDGVAVDTNYIYWGQCLGFGTSPSIGRANLDGTAADDAFIPFDQSHCPIAVAVDAG